MENQHRRISGYRDLTQREIDLINEVKAQGEALKAALDALTGDAEIDQRALAIARTEIQTGFMWLIRAIAQPTTFL
ncbi:MAG: hypothetical protein IT529_06140 [Burkholderiales bacterium]|nr:hypothetical protein [Burkholderiales bacterium]